MIQMRDIPVAQRVLILVGSQDERAVVGEMAERLGAIPVYCSDVTEFAHEIQISGDAAVVSEDAAYSDAVFLIQEALASQPEWSFLPVILIAALGADTSAARVARERIPGLQVVERPVGKTTLESVVAAALVARRRQYQLRDLLDGMAERERALRAIEGAQERELQVTRTLLRVAESLSEWTNLTSVLRTLTEAVVRVTNHTRATFAVWDMTKEEVRVVASSGNEPISPFAASLYEFSPPFIEVTKTWKTTVADYDNLPKEDRQMADLVHSHRGLLVPMVYRNRLVGGLFVDDPGVRGEFPEDEIKLIEAIAALAAAAVENARLFEAQSNIAGTLQEAFFQPPKRAQGLRFSHLYRSATEAAAVGGDFYDFIDLRDDGYLVLVGDIAGHGIEAARAATFVRDVVAAFASEGRGVGRILSDTNEALLRMEMSNFVTVLLACIRPDRRSITFCSAGHPHFVLRNQTGASTLVGVSNHPPLGVFPAWQCEAETIALSPSDLLLFYTDGVTEARHNGELFGEARLVDWVRRSNHLPLAQLPSTLLREVLAFSEGTLRDDVAIVAVEIEA